MEFKRQRRRADIDINMTPLIDVVFLLLIFFMVSTTFTRESHLSLKLPEASAEPTEAPLSPIEILISAEGRYTVNDKELINDRLEVLRQALQEAALHTEAQFQHPLIITADAATPHQAVVRAMDAAGQLGFAQLSLTTRQPAEE